MPYLPYLDEEQKKNDQANQQQISGGSTTINQSSQNVAAPKPVANSGSWTNINSYLDANKDQASDMGNQIADSVTKQATEAESKINYLAAEKQQQVAAVDTNKYFSNPLATTEDDSKDYAKLKTTGGYEGPSDISGTKYYNEALNATNQASAKVKNAASEEGRMNLLADQYNRPTYSQGSKVLDNALLQGNTQAKETLNQVNQRFSGLNSMFDKTQFDVADSIGKANTQAFDNKKQIIEDEANAWNNLLNPIKQRAADYNTNKNTLINKYESDLNDDLLSEDTMNLLGLGSGTKLYDMNLKNYLQKDLTEAGVNNVANSEERAKYAALQKLIQDSSRSELTTDGKQLIPIAFDKELFKTEQARKQAELENIFKNTVLKSNTRFDHQNGQIVGFADANVADYLARGTDAVNTSSTFSGGGSYSNPFTTSVLEATNQGYADGKQMAKSRLLPQLEDFLKQQNYYRTVKKV